MQLLLYLGINTLFSFFKERANTWLLHQKSEDFSVGNFKSFCIIGVQSYNSKQIFQQSTLLLTNHRTADQSNMIPLVEKVLISSYWCTLVRRYYERNLDGLGLSGQHHLEISYYVNFLGRLVSNGFQLFNIKVWHPWHSKKIKILGAVF